MRTLHCNHVVTSNMYLTSDTTLHAPFYREHRTFIKNFNCREIFLSTSQRTFSVEHAPFDSFAVRSLGFRGLLAHHSVLSSNRQECFHCSVMGKECCCRSVKESGYWDVVRLQVHQGWLVRQHWISCKLDRSSEGNDDSST